MSKASYLQNHTAYTPKQTEPLDDKQVKMRSGGYAWKISKWDMLNRFLLIGTEGGTYYANERDITKENVDNLKQCIKEDGVRTVEAIYKISDEGRAPKNDPALFALAFCVALGDQKTKNAVKKYYKQIARIGTHHLMFVSFLDAIEGCGWGSYKRKLVGSWYDRPDNELAYQVVKYQNRAGWTHADVLSKCHFGKNSTLFRWITKKSHSTRHVVRKVKVHANSMHDEHYRTQSESNYPAVSDSALELPKIVEGYEAAKVAETESDIIRLIKDFGLTHEMIPNQWKNKNEVWSALLKNMPITATIRNLGKMTSLELLTPLGHETSVVTGKFTQESIRKARVHPINILIALRTYQSGGGHLGKLTWTPVPQICDALDDAFYYAFDNIEPTGKRIFIALDVSGSMSWGAVSGSTVINPMEASAAMSMAVARTEDKYHFAGFTTSMVDLNISRKMDLNSVIQIISNVAIGGTDCSKPIMWALDRKYEVDAFVMFTDNESWAGRIHPSAALEQYRKKMGIDAKMVTCAMTATETTLSNPDLSCMLDICGFGTDTPTLINEFLRDDVSQSKQ